MLSQLNDSEYTSIFTLTTVNLLRKKKRIPTEPMNEMQSFSQSLLMTKIPAHLYAELERIAHVQKDQKNPVPANQVRHLLSLMEYDLVNCRIYEIDGAEGYMGVFFTELGLEVLAGNNS